VCEVGGVYVGLVGVQAMRDVCNLSNPIKTVGCEILGELHKDKQYSFCNCKLPFV